MRQLALTVLLLAAASGTDAQHSAGHLLVLNKEDAALVIVDPDSGSVLGRAPTGDQPHEVVVSSDGQYAFASNYGGAPAAGHTISMIDLAAKKEVRRIDVAPLSRPHGLDFAGGKLYFTAEGSKAIARYDPAANKIDWQFETGQQTTHMVLVARDLKTIFTSNIGSDNVSRIVQGADGRWTQTTIPVGKGPEGIDLSPDGREVWSAGSRDGTVFVVDAASGSVAAKIDAGTKRSNRIKLTPDARFALISDVDTGELVVVDAPARTVARRIAVGKQPEGVLIAPDGSRAFVAVNGDNKIAIVDLEAWQVVKTLSPGIGPDGMAWVR